MDVTLLGILGAAVKDVQPEKVQDMSVTLVALLISGATSRAVQP